MRHLYILILVAVMMKVILLFAFNANLAMNHDEEYNYCLAAAELDAHVNCSNEFTGKIYKSFHSYGPVAVYKFLISNQIKKETWIIAVHFITLVLFAFSITSFFKLALYFLRDEKISFYATMTYAFYPSIACYIGTLFFYENFVLFLLVIVIHRLMAAAQHKFSVADYVLLPLGVAFSCLFRSQMILVYSIVLATAVLLYLKKRKLPNCILPVLIAAITFLFHVPILLKHKTMYGSYILSTQPGFELLQGHNPTARGSWMGNWQDSTNSLFKYAHEHIKDISLLNEYEEGVARKKLALQWIKENPIDELKLALRKLAIYFLPFNFEFLKTYDWFNPVNFLVHLGFILFFIQKLVKKKFVKDEMILLAPVIASLILTLLFFVGYRWRYFAEPFMILFTWLFIVNLKAKSGT